MAGIGGLSTAVCHTLPSAHLAISWRREGDWVCFVGMWDVQESHSHTVPRPPNWFQTQPSGTGKAESAGPFRFQPTYAYPSGRVRPTPIRMTTPFWGQDGKLPTHIPLSGLQPVRALVTSPPIVLLGRERKRVGRRKGECGPESEGGDGASREELPPHSDQPSTQTSFAFLPKQSSAKLGPTFGGGEGGAVLVHKYTRELPHMHVWPLGGLWAAFALLAHHHCSTKPQMGIYGPSSPIH